MINTKIIRFFYGTITLYGTNFPVYFKIDTILFYKYLYGLNPVSLATTPRISVDFYYPGYWDVSLHQVFKFSKREGFPIGNL